MTQYIRNNKTISGKLNDELVMMDVDQGKYFSLNPVATRIWELLEKPRAFDELCVLLLEEYDIDAATCRSETGDCLEDMVRVGLVLKEVKADLQL